MRPPNKPMAAPVSSAATIRRDGCAAVVALAPSVICGSPAYAQYRHENHAAHAIGRHNAVMGLIERLVVSGTTLREPSCDLSMEFSDINLAFSEAMRDTSFSAALRR
jgi:hypothetical protein